MKRAYFGTIVSLLAACAACVGLIAYIMNTGTTYFVGLGKSMPVICSLIVGIVALLAWVALGEAKVTWKDILPLAAPSLFMFGFLTLLNSRINGIAAIMTFEANEANMADLKSALVALVFMAVAAVLACVGAFANVKKRA